MNRKLGLAISQQHEGRHSRGTEREKDESGTTGGILASLSRAQLVVMVILIFAVLGPGHNFLLLMNEPATNEGQSGAPVASMHYLDSSRSSNSRSLYGSGNVKSNKYNIRHNVRLLLLVDV